MVFSCGAGDFAEWTCGSGGDRDETIETIETIEIFLWFSLVGRAILQNGPTDPAEIGMKP